MLEAFSVSFRTLPYLSAQTKPLQKSRQSFVVISNNSINIKSDFLIARSKPEAPHTHDCMEIMYIRSGAACCCINNCHYPVVRGDIYVLAPGDIHEFFISGKLSHDTLLFSMELFSAEEKENLLTHPVFHHWILSGNQPEKKLSIPLTATAKLDQMFDDLALECQRPLLFNNMLRKALLIRLLFFALEKGSSSGQYQRQNDLQLSRLFDFISNYYHQDISLNAMAKAASVSQNYLNEFMQRSIGQGAMEYLIRYRVEQARCALENTEMTVSQIAAATGFYDASHFIRIFKRCTGMTPGQYRKLGSGIY